MHAREQRAVIRSGEQHIEQRADSGGSVGERRDSRERGSEREGEGARSTLRRHLPIYGPEGLIELRKIAGRFEEKIFDSASSLDDYLRKISLKMLTMEAKSQSTSGHNFSQASSAT
ncbi:hypothetical protein Syun_022979 [Stephania yunnanensis]|uniref:Mediator complex subunit 15 KIX domain-containing protein n=1 Tax=Stephania yunnanensis TaxID=152371 RepID=A0AAP0FF36_9MAGN